MVNVKAELYFETNHSNAIKPGFYIHEYLQRPFYVDAIHTVYGNNFEHYLCPTLTQNVKSLTLSGTDPIDFTSISQVFFPHLSFLQIEQQLDAEEFRSLPRNLKAFVGNMKNTNASQMKLEFPETLNKLHLKVDSMHGDVMCQFDISHLTKLHDARIEPLTVVIGFRGENTPLLGSWNLPNSLQKLWIYYNRMIIGKLETIGSSITELEIHCHYEGDDNDFIQDLSIPESVKVLAIPSSFLSYTGRSITLKFLKDHPQLRYRVKFPDGLMKLKLTGNSDIRRTLVLDFYVHKFPNLEELILWLPGHVNAIGKFPKRIKKYMHKNHEGYGIGTIATAKIFDMNKFRELDGVTEIVFDNIQKRRSFDYELPQSIRRLSCIGNDLRSVEIDAPKLEYLNLSKNRLTPSCYGSLVVPPVLKELILSECNFTAFSHPLPDNLYRLDLSHNYISVIRNLPNNLKVLNCDGNHLGSNESIVAFPPGLIHLSLRSNLYLTAKHIDNLNLLQCYNLRVLNLSYVSLGKLNLDSLPRSLQQMDLSNCQLYSFHGSFLRFQFLEDINLNNNNLSGYFYNAFNCFGALFGNNIQVVSVYGNILQPMEVQLLWNDLSTKSKFKRLSVDRGLVQQPAATAYPPVLAVNSGVPLESSRPQKQRRLNT